MYVYCIIVNNYLKIKLNYNNHGNTENTSYSAIKKLLCVKAPENNL